MKRVKIMIPFALIALVLGFSACKKDTSSSSGSSTLGVKIQAQNKSYSLPVDYSGIKSSSAATASITWDTARMTVSRVKYEAELKSLIAHRDSIKIEYEWKGPQEVNLFDTNISIGNFILQPGFYDEMEISVKGFKHDAGDKPVFYMHGLYTRADGTVLPIRFIVNEDVMFKTEKDSVEVTSNDNSGFTSIIQLKLNQLFADIQLPALDFATQTNGSIIISSHNNTQLYMIIMRNLHKDHHSKHNRHGHGYGSMDGHMN